MRGLTTRRLASAATLLLAGAALGAIGAVSAAAVTGPVTGPVAGADSYSVQEDGTLTVDEPGLLANDTDDDGGYLFAVDPVGPKHGDLLLEGDGSFVYTPEAGFHGSDSFTYRASDTAHKSAPAKVSITVKPGPNAAPVAKAESYAVAAGGRLAGSVLANDKDGDGDRLTAKLASSPKHADFHFASTGKFTYVPDAGYSGADSFTYRANDGEKNSTTTKVSITVTKSNKCAASVSIGSAATVTEGNSGTRKLIFPVKAYRTAKCGALTVKLRTAGTATKGTDYTAPSATVVIPKGKSTATLSVSVKGDRKVEPDETVTLTLTSVSAPSGSPKLGVAKGTGKIRNDDKRS